MKWLLLRETPIFLRTRIKKNLWTISWKDNAIPSSKEATVEAAKNHYQKEKKRRKRVSKKSLKKVLPDKRREKEDPQLKRSRESP